MINYKAPKNLLSKGNTNAKTAKNNFDTYILYLAPHKQNSLKINICPKASKGCAASCLFSAGRGKFSNVVKARINKTEYFLQDKKGFINQLANELIKINSANFDIDNYTNLHFYDYTKILGKVKKYANDKNYTLTFSRAEDNESDIFKAIQYGANVSAVFSGDLPKEYKNIPVIDGDKTDNEMLKYKGYILGLKAKGDAKKDTSGFVINN